MGSLAAGFAEQGHDEPWKWSNQKLGGEQDVQGLEYSSIQSQFFRKNI
jgi:hypothetical protein